LLAIISYNLGGVFSSLGYKMNYYDQATSWLVGMTQCAVWQFDKAGYKLYPGNVASDCSLLGPEDQTTITLLLIIIFSINSPVHEVRLSYHIYLFIF